MPLDTTTLQMALLGYEAERQKMQEKIDELQARLNGRASSPMTRNSGQTHETPDECGCPEENC